MWSEHGVETNESVVRTQPPPLSSGDSRYRRHREGEKIGATIRPSSLRTASADPAFTAKNLPSAPSPTKLRHRKASANPSKKKKMKSNGESVSATILVQDTYGFLDLFAANEKIRVNKRGMLT